MVHVWRRGLVWIVVGLIGIYAWVIAGVSIVRADVILPGKKNLSYCFEIANVAAYPDYVFLAYFGDPGGGHAIIKAADCVQFYKFSHPRLFATRAAGFAAASIPTDRAAERAYFTSNAAVLRSDIEISAPGQVDQSDPVDGIVDVFRVVSLDDSALRIAPDSVRYSFTDGRKETLPYQAVGMRPAPSRTNQTRTATVPAATVSPGTPEPSQPLSDPPTAVRDGHSAAIWYGLAIPAIAAIGIALVLWRRRRGSTATRDDRQ